MNPYFPFDAFDGDISLDASWGDGQFVFCRAWRHAADGKRDAVVAVLPAAEHPPPASPDRLAHEYALKDELDRAWAVRPLEIVREGSRTMLVLEDSGGEPLDRRLAASMEVGSCLRPANGIATALGKAPTRPRPQGRQAGQYRGEPDGRTADLPSPPRATVRRSP